MAPLFLASYFLEFWCQSHVFIRSLSPNTVGLTWQLVLLVSSVYSHITHICTIVFYFCGTVFIYYWRIIYDISHCTVANLFWGDFTLFITECDSINCQMSLFERLHHYNGPFSTFIDHDNFYVIVTLLLKLVFQFRTAISNLVSITSFSQTPLFAHVY